MSDAVQLKLRKMSKTHPQELDKPFKGLESWDLDHNLDSHSLYFNIVGRDFKQCLVLSS